MFCEKCGFNNNDGASFCRNCGAPITNAAQQSYPPYQPPVQTVKPKIPSLGMGITSMVLGATTCAFLCYAVLIFPCAIVGLILGCMANSRAKAVGLKNGFATAGIITSVIGIVMVLLSLVFFIFLFDTIDSGYYYDYYYFINSLML